MDSTEYFKRAEKTNRRFRVATLIAVFVGIGIMIGILIAIKTSIKSNHDSSLRTLNSIECVVLLTPQTYNRASVNKCFQP